MINAKKQIWDSTAEFLIFAAQNEADAIEVRFEEETLWLTQQLMAELFQTSRTNIVEHIQHIYDEGELKENPTCRRFRQVCREYAENEFEKYRVIQDRLFKSDFDRQMDLLESESKDKGNLSDEK